MPLRRHHHALARFALALFVLTVIAAGLGPIVHAEPAGLICSASEGANWKWADDGQANTATGHTLDCALCLVVTPPPRDVPGHAIALHPLAHALRPSRQAHLAALVGAPLPPRGPPAA